MTKRKFTLALGSSAIALAALPSTVAAQAGAGYREIIVTAQKREENLMDVGQTLAVLGGDQLDRQNIVSNQDLAAAVPSLTYARSDYNTPIYTLRGVGFNEASLGVYPAVSVYVDEAPLVFPILAANAAFDLERVEVLKGPQGTLFGQNSTGGAINMVMRKPTDTLSAAIRGTYGRFNQFDVQGHISGPLGDGIAARLAFSTHHMDAWQKSATRPDDRNGKEEVYMGRAMLEIDPGGSFRALLTVNAWKDKSEPQALALAATKYSDPSQLGTPLGAPIVAQPIVPTQPRLADWGGPIGPADDPFIQGANPTILFSDRELVQGIARFEFEPSDDLLITSVTSYVDFNQSQSLDRDGSAIQNQDQTRTLGDVSSFNTELRLENTDNGRLRWVVGANYEKSEVSERQLQSYVNNSIAIATGIFQNTINLDSDMENWAVFGNVEFDVTDSLTFKAGARYTDSSYKFNSCNTDEGDGNIQALFNFLGDALGGGTPFDPIGVGPGECFTLDFDNVPRRRPDNFIQTLNEDNVSWRVGIDYNATDDVLLYANVSKGYKQGSFPTSSPAGWVGLLPVTQESVLAFEGGFKAQLADRRVNINGAAFLYKYDDKQIRGSIGDPIFEVLPQLRNVPKSEIKGAELEINTTPVEGLRLGGSVVYLDTEITEIDPNEFNALGQIQDLEGFRIPFTAKWNARIDGEYSVDMGSVKPFIGATYTYTSNMTAAIGGEVIQPIPIDPMFPQNRFVPGYERPYRIKGYGILDARVGIGSPEGNWEAYLWCKNCTNEYYWVNVTTAEDNISRGTGRPRTFGLTLGYKY